MAMDDGITAKGASSAASAPSPDPGLKSASNTLKETLVELKKTTWPTRAEANRLTFVVIAVIIALGFYMGLLDYLLSSVDRIFKLT